VNRRSSNRSVSRKICIAGFCRIRVRGQARAKQIGEETGELDGTSIIEPILMIGVGVMVGTIVISMYLPMFKMLTLIR
jgi:hypothetical protein